MSADDIAVLLKKLHVELASATTLDAESREQLSIIARDAAKFESQLSTVRRLAVRFETEHPGVAAVLRQLTDMFAKAGI